MLSRSPVLILPKLDEDMVVRTDASSTGVGAVLLQEREGSLHPVAFASKKLSEREQRYSTIERECLAIVWATERFQRYLWGKPFLLQTHHNPL